MKRFSGLWGWTSLLALCVACNSVDAESGATSRQHRQRDEDADAGLDAGPDRDAPTGDKDTAPAPDADAPTPPHERPDGSPASDAKDATPSHTSAMDAAVMDAAAHEEPASISGSVGQLAGNPGVQLAFRVTDAEFSRDLNRIVIVAENPDRLIALDPETSTYQAVELPHTALAVSVRPDGRSAAVAHDRFVSIVQLAPLKLLETFAVNALPLDVVYAANGFVYLFDRRQSPGLDIVEIATHTERLGSVGVFGGGKARLHPAGDRIYGMRNTSPSDLERYDMASGPVEAAYDSAFHGDYPMGDDLWFTQDGRQIVTSYGYTFSSRAERASDVKYAGALEGTPLIQHLDHSSAAGLLAVLHRDNFRRLPDVSENVGTQNLSLYEDAYLTWRQTLTLPSFDLPGKQYASAGRFAFFDASGERLYVLIEADITAPTSQDWGLARYDIQAHAGVTPPPAAKPLEIPQQQVEQGRMLSVHPVDAEYSRTLERIVLAQSSPDQLLLIQPATGLRQVIDLPLAPRAVSLHPDGRRAVVTHDGFISTVDLVTHVVERTTAISIIGGDAVFCPDGYAYVLPDVANGTTSMHALDSMTGGDIDTQFSAVVDGHIRLHPSGARFYVTSQKGSPRLERYDVAAGVPQSMPIYTSFNDHPICDDLWFSADGARLFTACGEVYQTSNAWADDLVWLATLEGAPRAAWIDYSAESALLAVARGTPPTGTTIPQNEVLLFDANTLRQRGRLTMPLIVVNDQAFESVPLFVFFDATGTQVHVLAQAKMQEPYGLALISVPVTSLLTP